MEQFKKQNKTNLAVDWNTQVGAEWDHTLEAHTNILTFMHKLNALASAKRIHWYTPGDIKHMCESWLKSQDNYTYVCRDLCTSFAIALGMPVDFKANSLKNAIGLHISQKMWSNLYMNISNNGAVEDLEFAMQTPYELYPLKKYKKEKQL